MNPEPYFDDDRPVPAVEPEVYRDEPEPEDTTATLAPVLDKLLDWLAWGTEERGANRLNMVAIGRRVLVLAYLMKRPGFEGMRQKELADLIGVSEPRMSAILKAVKLFSRP